MAICFPSLGELGGTFKYLRIFNISIRYIQLISGPLQPEMIIPYVVTPLTYLLTLQDHNYYKNSLNNM